MSRLCRDSPVLINRSKELHLRDTQSGTQQRLDNRTAYSTQVRVWSAQKRSRQIAARRSVMQVSGNDQTSGKEERETVPQ